MLWMAVGAGAWLAFALVCRLLMRNPRGTVDAGAFLLFARVYARLVHRLRVVGREHLPAVPTGPLIVIANHTAGIDPLLVQAAVVTFEVRWMMALDMQIPAFEAIWRWARVIGVRREQAGDAKGPDLVGVRESLGHLRRGGVLGIFPEGAIERPPGRVMAFLPGVGVLAARSGAPVLPVLIRGTPHTKSAWGSLLRPSRSVVEFLPVVRFAPRSDPAQVTRDLEAILTGAMERASAPARHLDTRTP